jgi:hypothetical protein
MKAFCERHGYAYEVSTGCADCHACDREALLNLSSESGVMANRIVAGLGLTEDMIKIAKGIPLGKLTFLHGDVTISSGSNKTVAGGLYGKGFIFGVNYAGVRTPVRTPMVVLPGDAQKGMAALVDTLPTGKSLDIVAVMSGPEGTSYLDKNDGCWVRPNEPKVTETPVSVETILAAVKAFDVRPSEVNEEQKRYVEARRILGLMDEVAAFLADNFKRYGMDEADALNLVEMIDHNAGTIEEHEGKAYDKEVERIVYKRRGIDEDVE